MKVLVTENGQAEAAAVPGGPLRGIGPTAERVFIEHLSGFSDDDAYRAMDFLLDAVDEIARRGVRLAGPS